MFDRYICFQRYQQIHSYYKNECFSNEVYFITNLYLSNDMYQDTIRIFIFLYLYIFQFALLKEKLIYPYHVSDSFSFS